MSPQSAAVRARRELRRAAAASHTKVLVGYVHPEVAQALKEHGEWLRALGRERGKTIIVRARPGMHIDRIVVAQGDDASAAEQAAANGQAAKAARVFWLDPIHGEGLDLPDDEPRKHGMMGAPDRPGSGPGWLARLWRRLCALRSSSSPPGDAHDAGARAETGPAGTGRAGRATGR